MKKIFLFALSLLFVFATSSSSYAMRWCATKMVNGVLKTDCFAITDIRECGPGVITEINGWEFKCCGHDCMPMGTGGNGSVSVGVRLLMGDEIRFYDVPRGGGGRGELVGTATNFN